MFIVNTLTKRSLNKTLILAALLLPAISCSTGFAQEASPPDASEIAKKLSNPIASLISVPLQFNWDDNFGADDGGSLFKLNVQPVIPISISDDWNLISRTILPIVDQDGFPFSDYNEFGLSDTVQSFFFSPKAPTNSGWIWGAGPVLLLPTATDDYLGTEKWGAGPTAVALKQTGPWTYGALVNHIWSFAGESNRADVNATFVQPFLSYITPKHTTYVVNTEATYDWEGDAWSVPINLQVNQLLKVGKQLLQVGGGVRYWVESPDAGPEGWGLRMNVVFVFPR
jgi:hypothetical protein